MSNRTYICTTCRTSRRAEAAEGLETPFRCSSCAGPLWELSSRYCIPKKTDDKAWNALKMMVDDYLPSRQESTRKRGESLLARLDRAQAQVASQPPGQLREDILRDLAQQRTVIEQRYFTNDSKL